MRVTSPLMFPTSPMAHRAIALSIGVALLFGQVQPVFSAFGDGTPTVPNPSLFSDSTTLSKVEGQSGAFTQKVPLDIPPGRNGLQPDVSLDYNSQRTKDSIVGYGWSLSVPYIERINKTGSQDIYGYTPYFSSSIGVEDVIVFEIGVLHVVVIGVSNFLQHPPRRSCRCSRGRVVHATAIV